jgi:hypothetical protein
MAIAGTRAWGRAGLGAIAGLGLGILVWGGGWAAGQSPIETERFRMQFPSAPRPIRHPLPWGDRAIEVQGYRWENAKLALTMTYMDLPPGSTGPGMARSGETIEPMDGIVRGWRERLGTNGSVTPWPTWGGNGQRITGTTGTGLAAEVRLVRVGDRVYTLTALSDPAAQADPETALTIQQFFESFEPSMAQTSD